MPLIKGGDVERGLSLLTLNCTSTEIDAEHARSRVSDGDIIFAIRGSYGAVARVPKQFHGANLTQDAARVSPGSSVDPDFLYYALRSNAVFAQLDAGAVGATIKGINIRDLKRAMIPCPPIQEQKQRAQLARLELDSVLRRRAEILKGISLLGELRSSLITAAVTGQIDVQKRAEFDRQDAQS